jgi:hypothetical protein
MGRTLTRHDTEVDRTREPCYTQRMRRASCSLQCLCHISKTALHSCHGDVASSIWFIQTSQVVAGNMSVVIEQCYVVKAEGNRRWYPMPDQVEEVDQQLFVHLEKWDREFIKFVTGKCLDLRKQREGSDCIVGFWDTLSQKRQQACDLALGMALKHDDEEDHVQIQHKRKFKHPTTIRAKEKDAVLVAPTVTISLDSFEDAHGTVDACEVSVLYKDIHKKSIWIELSSIAIEYVKRAINYDIVQGNPGKVYGHTGQHTKTCKEARRRGKVVLGTDAPEELGTIL